MQDATVMLKSALVESALLKLVHVHSFTKAYLHYEQDNEITFEFTYISKFEATFERASAYESRPG
jgi:hypothetical protein